MDTCDKSFIEGCGSITRVHAPSADWGAGNMGSKGEGEVWESTVFPSHFPLGKAGNSHIKLDA